MPEQPTLQEHLATTETARTVAAEGGVIWASPDAQTCDWATLLSIRKGIQMGMERLAQTRSALDGLPVADHPVLRAAARVESLVRMTESHLWLAHARVNAEIEFLQGTPTSKRYDTFLRNPAEGRARPVSVACGVDGLPMATAEQCRQVDEILRSILDLIDSARAKLDSVPAVDHWCAWAAAEGADAMSIVRWEVRRTRQQARNAAAEIERATENEG